MDPRFPLIPRRPFIIRGSVKFYHGWAEFVDFVSFKVSRILSSFLHVENFSLPFVTTFCEEAVLFPVSYDPVQGDVTFSRSSTGFCSSQWGRHRCGCFFSVCYLELLVLNYLAWRLFDSEFRFFDTCLE